MGVDKYQDLECWRLANDLKLEVYALVNNSSARHDLKFCEQIVDSARSGPRNIAEGFGRYEHPEFARFLCFARGSILETHNHVGDGCDSGYWSASDRDRVRALADRAIASTTGLIGYLRRTRAPSLSQSRQRSRKDRRSGSHDH
jgi:four helix bundle protein